LTPRGPSSRCSATATAGSCSAHCSTRSWRLPRDHGRVTRPLPPVVTPRLRDKAQAFGLTTAEFDEVVTRLGREPNAVEAGVFGALWSEHCGYKNSRPLLRLLPTEGAAVLQGPGENAGV